MAKARISVMTKRLRAVLEKHSEFVQKSVPQLVRAHARLCAVELAHRTTPFSVGSAGETAKKKGENRVANDIRKIIMRKEDFTSFTNNFGNEKVRARIQHLIAGGNWIALKGMLDRIGYASQLGGVEFVKRSDIAATHKIYRDKKTGRTIKQRDKMYISIGKLDPYIKKAIAKVGMSKGGWADCARQISTLKGDGAREIPQWAKRHKKGGRIEDKTNKRSNPRVLMTNTYPWISRICTPAEQKKSVRIASEKMLISFDKALKAAAKAQKPAIIEP